MTSTTRHIADTSLGYWPTTRPKQTPGLARIAAENQITRALLQELGITPPSRDYRAWLLRHYPDLIEEAQAFIGVTIEVYLEEGETPRGFRERFGRDFDHKEGA